MQPSPFSAESRFSKGKDEFNGGKDFPNFWEIFGTNFVLGQKSQSN